MLALVSLVDICMAFSPSIQRGRLLSSHKSIGISLPLQKNDDSEETEEELSASEKEGQTSKKVIKSLLFSYNLEQASGFALRAFVVVALLLNLFGYSFILKDGGMVVGTLEERQFQLEINKSMKERR